MSNAVWPPSIVRKFSASGFSEKTPNVVVRTSMDAGPVKIRRRFTAGVRPIVGKMKMKSSELATFDTFFNTTLNGGALPFDWTHPRTGVAATYRFTEEPEYTADEGDWWLVSMKLEIMP